MHCQRLLKAVRGSRSWYRIDLAYSSNISLRSLARFLVNKFIDGAPITIHAVKKHENKNTSTI